MKFGDYGNQVCLKSKKAFDCIKFTKHYPALASRFYQSAKDRDKSAKQQYWQMQDTTTANIYAHLQFQAKKNMADSLGKKLTIR